MTIPARSVFLTRVLAILYVNLARAGHLIPELNSRILTALVIWLTAWTASADTPVDFVRDVRPIFEKHCYDCHSGTQQESGLRLDIKASAMKGGDNAGPDIVPGRPQDSPLIALITATDSKSRMPPDGQLSKVEIDILMRWINEGAVWPEGVDRVALEDKHDHWSFRPLTADSDNRTIDEFISGTLSEHGLTMSEECDPLTWRRRVSFDLTGFPPTPDDVREFQQQLDNASTATGREQVFATAVDRLLASERYGERWAQHWLDVVRYADTHGFEVNTERPNAWPYRDYVIRAFNQDTPYDRFIREQIAGDAMGEDAATGFLVTASVLLPGQIGKDAPSIRLARQDSLDEIVNNIGQTFLGLSVGCARCHDHKFDPITSVDYYAMQALVAGVEYADREIQTAEAEVRRQSAEPLRKQVREINDRLAQLAPLARPDVKARTTLAHQNIESFEPLQARFVRFTIHDSSVHPNLGLIEPCIDEFEIFTAEPQPQPQNVALATFGTKVTASGSQSSSSHQLEFVNDGQYGNSRSWMSATKGYGWLLFELPAATRIDKVIWSRDRLEQYDDRLPTAFTLEAGPSIDQLTTVSEALAPRPTVGAAPVNVDRFQPLRTQQLRFTILGTNGLEPCLDEIEVFNTAGQNIALASLGTVATTSGSNIEPNRHEPGFVNDGQYGNERSWLSSEPGKGQATLVFPFEQEITRVLWSRDRLGRHLDRLPVEYRIEVRQGADWQVVADSSDRRPHVAGMPRGPDFTFSGLTQDDAEEARRLLADKAKLEGQIRAAESGQLAFAGTFRQPDEIRLLSRGDPEQPREEVLPAMLSAFSRQTLPKTTPEQSRRVALADWIANSQNPLTSRVMVNRIWQGHFGSGLVRTPSDLGWNGMPPSHPKLLDWLATEFMRSGWSVKHMHRLIVLSRTYRQSSASRPDAEAKDADVRFLWRYPSRRLEAESIRDSMLMVSGLLNLQMYGRGFDLFDQRGGLSGFKPVEQLTSVNQRRMIYAHKVRRETEAVFGAFDCPDAGQSTALRRASTTPVQALNLFNSNFTLQVSAAFAERVQREAQERISDQIDRVYQLALSRSPTSDERLDAESVVRENGLEVLCRAILNSNEFVFMP